MSRWKNAWAWLCAAVLLVACGGGGSEGSPPAPSISTQPQSAAADDGATANFSVSASGGSTLRYQWSRNGLTIAGAIGSTYTTPALTLADHGAQFAVLVTNEQGSVQSQAATLSVRALAPRIEAHPTAQTVPDGQPIGLFVQASGSHPLSYQWLRDGQPIQGATDATLRLPSVTLADSGANWTVRVGNMAGSVTSNAALVTVQPVAASIGMQPEAAAVQDGAGARFHVMAKGSEPLRYQWLVDDLEIDGATASSLDLTARYADNGRRYRVRVSNAWGSALSNAVLLIVHPLAPSMVQAPKDAELPSGNLATFSVLAGGTAPLRYQWQRSSGIGGAWRDIPGATAAQFEIPNLTLSWSNDLLRVVVSNVVAAVPSNPVRLRVVPRNRMLVGRLGGRAHLDGPAPTARFSEPIAAAMDKEGNVLVADEVGIRRVSRSGEVTTPLPYAFTDVNGPAGVARLGGYNSFTADASGRAYIGGFTSIRVMTPDGSVSTLAGTLSGQQAHGDGVGPAAKFGLVKGMVLDEQGNLTVIDQWSQTVRTVSKDGVVKTIAGEPLSWQQSWVEPRDGPGAQARFMMLRAIARAADGSVYVGDSHIIRRVLPDGTTSHYAGRRFGLIAPGDGPRMEASFGFIESLAFDPQGRLYVVSNDGWIQRIDLDGVVRTLAGPSKLQDGLELDGAPDQSGHLFVNGLHLTPDGQGFTFANRHAKTVRHMALDGTLRTLAGFPSRPVDEAYPLEWVALTPGVGAAAQFAQSLGIRAAPGGDVLLSTGRPALPAMRLVGDQELRSLPLTLPEGHEATEVTQDALGNTYATVRVKPQRYPSYVAKFDVQGRYTAWAGNDRPSGADSEPSRDGLGREARFDAISQFVAAANGVLHMTDKYGAVRRIDTEGRVSTLFPAPAGACIAQDGPLGQARLCSRSLGMVMDSKDGALIIAENDAGVVRRVDARGMVSTVAGQYLVRDSVDGWRWTGTFDSMRAATMDDEGNIFVLDGPLVRRISRDGYVSTVMGVKGLAALQPNQPGGGINRGWGIAWRKDGRLIVGTELAIISD